MRLRPSDRERPTAGAAERVPDAASSGRQLLKHLLTAAGVLAFTYAVVRTLGQRDDVPVQSVDEVQAGVEDAVPDELRTRAADAVPVERPIATIRDRTGVTVPDDITEITIDGPRSEESETEPGIESATGASGSESDVTGLAGDEGDAIGERTNESGDALDETETNAEYADDRSDEEIAERAAADVSDEPAEPGEMAVDEDVADDLVGDETDTEADSGASEDESEE